MSLFLSLLHATIEAAPALVFAGVGAVMCERSGIINVGVEGMMRFGAFFAALLAMVLPGWLAFFCAAPIGALVGLIHAFLCIRLKANQVVAGIALNLLALSSCTYLLEALFHSHNLSPVIVPLSKMLFGHSIAVWVALAVSLFFGVLLSRTHFGLRIRAAGDKPRALQAAGFSVERVQFFACMISGALAAVGGASLSLGTLDRFENHMPSGLGFMAVAAMVLGRWTVKGATLAAILFAAAQSGLVTLTTTSDNLTTLPKGVFMALPYILTLCVLGIRSSKSGVPLAIGEPFEKESRS